MKKINKLKYFFSKINLIPYKEAYTSLISLIELAYGTVQILFSTKLDENKQFQVLLKDRYESSYSIGFSLLGIVNYIYEYYSPCRTKNNPDVSGSIYSIRSK